MNPFFIALALAAGACIPLQAGVNAALSRYVAGPVQAALISFTVGTIGLAVLCLAARLPLPLAAAVGQTHVWHWLGGLLGAFLVSLTVFLAPKIGAATMIALIVAGQMFGSIVLDHFGWVGYDLRPASFARLAGALLIVAGVILVRKF